MKNILETKGFRIGLVVLLECIFGFALFSAGLLVGFRKAQFTGGWYEGYRKNFPPPHMGHPMPLRDGINSHSVVGQVLSIENNTLLVKSPEGVEKTVVVGEKTSIRKFRDEIKMSDVKVGDSIVVIGAPDQQGRVNASLIRVNETPQQ